MLLWCYQNGDMHCDIQVLLATSCGIASNYIQPGGLLLRFTANFTLLIRQRKVPQWKTPPNYSSVCVYIWRRYIPWRTRSCWCLYEVLSATMPINVLACGFRLASHFHRPSLPRPLNFEPCALQPTSFSIASCSVLTCLTVRMSRNVALFTLSLEQWPQWCLRSDTWQTNFCLTPVHINSSLIWPKRSLSLVSAIHPSVFFFFYSSK